LYFNPDPNAGFTAGGGDPLLAFDNNGRAYMSWLALTFGFGTPPLKLTLYLATSDDKGQTWSDPLPIAIGTGNLDLGTGALTGSLVDKQWMVADQSEGAYSGNLYVSYTEINQVSATEGTSRILVKTLAAGNTAFGPEVQVHTSDNYIFMQFSSIDVDPEGQVHVSFVATEPSGQVGIYHAVSTDGGQTFNPETKVSNLYYPPGNGGTLTNGISGIDDAGFILVRISAQASLPDCCTLPGPLMASPPRKPKDMIFIFQKVQIWCFLVTSGHHQPG
jgi:hypothetical protein